MSHSTREIRLKSRPIGVPSLDNFEIAATTLPDPVHGEVLVRNHWLSVDPYMRGRMYDRPSYVPPFRIGAALEGGAVGEVLASNDPAFAVGDMVSSMLGWREAFVAPATALTRLPAGGAPPQAYLGVLGIPGLTAYAGLLQLGEPKPGETVLVSGAGGAVGQIVCQIAKLKGCKVVASAGSDEKLAWLKEAGVDAGVNYKTCGELLPALRAVTPKGVDIYFDNVGGAHLEAALELARPFARFVECGMIASYNDTGPTPGPQNMSYIIGKRIRMQGFIVLDFFSLHDKFEKDMNQWIDEGAIRWEETVESGLEKTPAAFLSLFSGGNTGKMLVKLV